MHRPFEIDLRALGFFRIALGLVLFIDLLIRLCDLTAHYTDCGVIPRDALVRYWWSPGSFSLHMGSGEWIYQLVLFSVHLAAVLCFVVGYRTRIAGTVSWLLLTSLHLRNPLVLQGGDVLLRNMFFFALFVPVGARFSIDGKATQAPILNNRLSNAATAALLLQVAILYWATVLLKSGREWFPDGTAVLYALNIELFAKPFGLWLRQFPKLLHWMTLGVWGFELLGPFLLFVPGRLGPTLRIVGVLGFCCLHFGLFQGMELGVFPFISAVAMIPFLPSGVWDRWEGMGRLVEKGFAKMSGWIPHYGAMVSAPRFSNVFAGAGLVLVVWYNLSTIQKWKIELPTSVDWAANAVRLDQYWTMFAPYPVRDDGWFVVSGELENGTEVDVKEDGERGVTWEKPALVSASFVNDRWRSLMMNLYEERYQAFRPYFAGYYCEKWNTAREEGDRLAHVRLSFFLSRVLPEGKHADPEKILLWDFPCFGDAEPQATEVTLGPS